jgi:PAS domain S-box-containing protein
MTSSRYAAEVERLRLALQGRQGRELMAALRRHLDSFPVAALAADDSSRYIASNRRATQLTGYTTAELAKLTVMDLTPPSNRKDGEQLWDDFVSTGEQSGHYELRQKGGTWVRVRYWAYASVAPGVHLSLLVAEPTAG